MFTIANIINYFSGKYVPTTVLILITFFVYLYLIRNWFDYFMENQVYLIIVLFLMLLDITSLIVILTYDFGIKSPNEQTLKSESSRKHKSKSKSKNNKKEKEKKSKKNIQPINVENIESKNDLHQNIGENQNMAKSEIISLYEPDKDVSLCTYRLI